MRALFMLLTAPFMLLDCSSKECTSVSCPNQISQTEMWTSVNVDRHVADLAGGRVRVCRETVCTEALFDGNACVGRTSVFLCRPDTTQNIGVTFVDFANAPPRNGERFEVSVLAPDDADVGSTKGTAHYTEKRPNGPACDPVCVQGELAIER